MQWTVVIIGGNYSLLCMTYTIFSNIFLNYLRLYAVDIEDYQSGFLVRRSTIYHIFTLKRLIEEYYEFNKKLHLLFVK